MKKPLVSLIVPTKNSAEVLGSCLESLKNQTYQNTEIIVVDNYSTDKTKSIARKYTDKVYDKKPERSAQRNFGAAKAKGEFVFFIDSDMILTPKVVEACVQELTNSLLGGLVIPEKSYGQGFWARAKAHERSFYLGNTSIEAARFFPKRIFKELGGFDEKLTGPEDWDFSQRVSKKNKIGRVNEFILHNEGKLSLRKTLEKKYYYSQKFAEYLMKKEHESVQQEQFSILGRYKVFFSQPKKLIQAPVLSLGMLFMKTGEFIAGGLGYLKSRREKRIVT